MNDDGKPTRKDRDPPAARQRISRRDFLNGVLIAVSGNALGSLSGCGAAAGGPLGGGAPLPEPARLPSGDKGDEMALCHAVRDGKRWQLPPPSGALHACVVLGGGIAGLVTAWKLSRSGVREILVLEKDDPIGGMARKDSRDGRLFSRSAAYTVMPYNDNLIELYRDLGVVTGLGAEEEPIVAERYLLRSPLNNGYLDGKWYRDVWDSGLEALPLSPKVIADLKAFREDMKAWYDFEGSDGKAGFDTPSDASTSDAEVRALDGISLLEYVTKKGWDPQVSLFFDRYIRSALGTTHDRASAWACINFLGAEFHPSMSQPGGNAYLSEALAAKLGPGRTQTGAFVLRAENVGDEVQVSYLTGEEVRTVRARAAVCAIPAYMAKHLLPGLASAGRKEAADFRYTPYVVANVHVSRTPPELAYDNWLHGDFAFTDVIVADWAGLADPARADPARPNVLTVYMPLLGPGKRAELLTKPLEYYEEIIFADLERVLPGVRETVQAFDLYRWGHAMLAAEKGFVFGPARLAAQAPLGRIHFACHDVDGLPAFENAVGAAYRAAGAVVAQLGA